MIDVYLLQVKWRSDEGDAKFGYRNTESFVSNDKDVAAVCSLSFHLPKDAVASGAKTGFHSRPVQECKHGTLL